MVRQPLALGSWGLIRIERAGRARDGQQSRYRARAKYRDLDGITRKVEAWGKSQTSASNALRLKLQNRAEHARQGELTAVTRFSDAADLWMSKFRSMAAEGRRSPSTVETYERQLKNHLLPAIGAVRLAELTTPMVDQLIDSIKRRVSPATARSSRSVLSGVMKLAVRYGAVALNPVREIDRIESPPKKAPRALTAEERAAFFQQVRQDPAARRRDLPDLVLFMIATGCRIGEALAVVWSQVDFDQGLVEITHTLVRIRGQGLLRKRTKTRAGERVLELPPTVAAILRSRFLTGARLEQPLFPDVLGGFRDPANVRRELRQARGQESLAWVTSHAFRRTAATILDEASLSARVVADQLGHSRPSMTQDVYLARRLRTAGTALALEQALQAVMIAGPEDEKPAKGVSLG